MSSLFGDGNIAELTAGTFLQSMLWPYRENINTICCVISRQLDLTVVGTWTSS